MKKDDPKKKKKLPFYGRAYGGAARARADRKAYRRGGSVKPTTEPISPNEPKAPATGKVLQQFKKGGVAKRADGGGASDDAPTTTRVPKSSSVADLTSAGLNPLLPALGTGDLLGGGAALGADAPAIPAGMPGGPPGPVPAFTAPPPPPTVDGGGAKLGMRRGGGVKKRQDGGDVPLPRPKPRDIDEVPDSPSKPVAWGGRLDPLEHTGPAPSAPRKKSEGWGLEEDVPEFLKIEGRDYGKQPAGLGEKILSTGKLLAQPAGAVINRARKDLGFKDGGKLSAAQRQSLPKSDFALPGRGKGPKGAGSGSYPIPDRSHAQNALARSSGKPVAAQVRAKVKAKYPDMED